MKNIIDLKLFAELTFAHFSPVNIFHFALYMNEDLVFTKKV